MAVTWPAGCRSTRPLDRVFVDLSGKLPTSAGGAQYLIMIVDDYWRMGCPYFLKRKSDVSAVFARFLADVNATDVPSTVECVRSDDRTELVRAEFVELLDPRGIRCEYILVGSPKHNGVVERHIAMALELAMASCLEDPRSFGDARLPSTGPLWAEACKYTCDGKLASVTDKLDMHTPYRKLHGRASFARLLPFVKPGSHHVKRTLKSEPKAKACFYLNGGNNHSQDRRKILISFGRTSSSRDVAWEHPRKPFLGLLPAEESPSPPLPPPPPPPPPARFPGTPESLEGPGVWYELPPSTLPPPPPSPPVSYTHLTLPTICSV